MKILYVTDLHGVKWKYELAFQLAKNLEVTAIINGGDLFPYERNQNDFITDFLDPFFSRLESNKMYYLGMVGNDDLRIFDELYQKTCDKYSYVVNLAQNKFILDNYEFIGFNWVVDYPFRLKDRCRKDTEDYVFQEQKGSGLLSTPEGNKIIPDWFSYVNTIPTIEEEINTLIRPTNMNRAIYVMHMPPSRLGFDLCYHGGKVGSKAVYDFIEKNQPLLSLHGHIHESPECSGKWFSYLGKTLCVQPGQSLFFEDYFYSVFIDLKAMNFKRLKCENNSGNTLKISRTQEHSFGF